MKIWKFEFGIRLVNPVLQKFPLLLFSTEYFGKLKAHHLTSVNFSYFWAKLETSLPEIQMGLPAFLKKITSIGKNTNWSLEEWKVKWRVALIEFVTVCVVDDLYWVRDQSLDDFLVCYVMQILFVFGFYWPSEFFYRFVVSTVTIFPWTRSVFFPKYFYNFCSI